MDERFENILRESSKLLLQYGIKSVSMDDVAKELGISKKTLYQFVKNKEELIQKILESKIDNSCGVMNDVVNSDLNAIDVILEISKQVSKTYKEATPSMYFDLQKYYPEVFKKYSERHKDVVSAGIKSNIKIGVEQGIYRDDLNIDLIAELYLQRLREIHNYEFLNNTRYSFKKIFEVMFDNHIRAIANEKGLDYYLKRKKSLKFKV
jgi:TetR/AcrR family transcriptional regulator, cholesterol catabolism regulator